MTHGNDTALRTVPSDFTGVPARMLGAGHALGRQDQQLFDELSRQISQQIID